MYTCGFDVERVTIWALCGAVQRWSPTLGRYRGRRPRWRMTWRWVGKTHTHAPTYIQPYFRGGSSCHGCFQSCQQQIHVCGVVLRALTLPTANDVRWRRRVRRHRTGGGGCASTVAGQ
jgi:hypothetical protein